MLKDKTNNVSLALKLAISMFVGFGLAMSVAPSPKTNGDCGVYKVNSKSVTSYILKPPLAPAPEPLSCPAVPKCESQVTKEENSVSKAETSNVDERQSRRHHRRRYRVKAYWK